MKKQLTLYICLLIVVRIILPDNGIRAEQYNLQDFLDRVEIHSTDLKLAGKNRELAGANKKEAVSTALPKIGATADYNRYLSDTYMYMDVGALTGEEEAVQKIRVGRNNEYQLSVGLTQTLFSLGVGNAIKAARQYQTLTDFVYDASYREIITFAKKGFYQTLLLKTVWDVRASSEDNAHENYLNVKDKYDNGLVSQFDLLQAEVRWKDMIPQTIQARRNYELALISLKNLAGIPVVDEIELAGSLDVNPDLPGQLPLPDILSSRPDYNALLWEEKLRTTGVNAERSGYYPTLTGSLAYSFSSQSDKWKFEEKNNVWVAGLTLSVPIYTGGYRQAKVSQARIELDRTRLRIKQAEDDINREITSIRLRLTETRDRITAAGATMEAARKAFEIAETSAANGLATQLELKDARIALDQALMAYHLAAYEYREASFDWDKAIGEVGSPSASPASGKK